MQTESLELRSIKHPCYDNSAHYRYARIHLPVARRCNMSCNYCDRKFCKNTPDSERPGVAERIVKPEEVAEYVRRIISRIPAETTTLGIAGPGEPLYNEETFESLRIVETLYPEMFKCVATNGVLVEDRIDELVSCGVTHLTITINAVKPETAAKIYSYVIYGGKKYTGVEAGELILERQYAGLREAASAGILVKVNTVLIPGINDIEIAAVAKEISRYAYVMNIMPLIPLGRFSSLRKPTHEEIARARMAAGRYIRQFYHCRACRADAFGVPGSLR